MAVTNALVPIQSFLPSPISFNNIGFGLYHSPDRSWKEAGFRVYRPDWVNDPEFRKALKMSLREAKRRSNPLTKRLLRYRSQ